jgi:Tol biopolymer transport system component
MSRPAPTPYPAPEVSPNMKWLRNRFLYVSTAFLLAGFVLAGCTSKEEPSEFLNLCGNASCGDLVMITADTSSSGYHYLNPSMSPDGSRVLFTADWWAIPSEPKDPGDAYYPNYRQICYIPLRSSIEPESSLSLQGGELIRLEAPVVRISGEGQEIDTALNDDKGDPIWEDDERVIFYMRLRVGNRLFRTRIDDPDATEPGFSTAQVLYMEPSDGDETPRTWQHLNPSLSRDRDWLVFTRTGCLVADSLETCSNIAIYAMDMSTAGTDSGYGALVFPLTREYSRIERPRFSPDGTKILFSGGLDVGGDSGSGTELFTIDFDTTGLASGGMELDHNLQRLTYTSYAEGDPLTGVLNGDANWSPSGSEIYFVSTRRAPTTTLHDRNIWRIPANGSRDPEIVFFSREDDLDPYIQDDGTLLFSSMIGFPEYMLARLEDEAYQRIKRQNELDHLENGEPLLTETQLRQEAEDERRDLENFAGIMSHLYQFRGF